MITYADYDTYESLLSEGFAIVDFYTVTCTPCKMFSKILEEIAGELPFVNIVKVNLTDYPGIGKKNDISAVPTVFFVKDGQILERSEGVMGYDEIMGKVSEYYYNA